MKVPSLVPSLFLDCSQSVPLNFMAFPAFRALSVSLYNLLSSKIPET